MELVFSLNQNFSISPMNNKGYEKTQNNQY